MFRAVAVGYVSLKALLKRHGERELRSGGGERRLQS
jgi:hypothetical protein